MIKIIRLKSGEELMGEVTLGESTHAVKDVSLIIPTENGIGLMDYMPYSTVPEKGLEIPSDFIAWIVDPVEGLLKQYKSIHSKIITPSQGLIT